MESKVVKQDFKRLDEFVKGLHNSKGFVVRIGILGKKNSRANFEAPAAAGAGRKGTVVFRGKRYAASSGMSNADVGFIHEFGKPKTKHGPEIPMRSFLRMPLLLKSDRIIREVTMNSMLKKMISGGGWIKIFKDLGIACERAILDAFDSRGFGSWRPVKRGGSPLIDTGQLRKSIASEVIVK